MFEVMGRKNDVVIQSDELKLTDQHTSLSGADIESVVLTARRIALLNQRTEVTQQDLSEALTQFIPSAQGLEKDMQEVAAVLECTQTDFLTEEWKTSLAKEEGRSALQQQLTRMRNIVEQL